MFRSIGAVILGSFIIVIGNGIGTGIAGASGPFLGVDFLLVFFVSGVVGAYVTTAIAKRAEYKHAVALIIITTLLIPANPRFIPLVGQPLWSRFLFAIVVLASVVSGTGLRAWLKKEGSTEAAAPNGSARKGIHPLSLGVAITCLLIGVALLVGPIAATQGEAALTGVSAWHVNLGAGAFALLVGFLMALISGIVFVAMLFDRPSRKAVALAIVVLIIGGYGVIRTGHWAYNSGRDDARKFRQVRIGRLVFFKPADWTDHGEEVDAVRESGLKSVAGAFPPGTLPNVPFLSLSPDRGALLMVIESTPNDPSLSSVVKDRQEQQSTAKKSGLISAASIELKKHGNLEVIVEDVTRADNGTRASTTKFLVGKLLYDVTLVVREGNQFPEYKEIYDILIDRLTVED